MSNGNGLRGLFRARRAIQAALEKTIACSWGGVLWIARTEGEQPHWWDNFRKSVAILCKRIVPLFV